jgi:hypothetical protein
MPQAEVERLVENRNPGCTNRKTIGGWGIGEFDESSVYLYQDPSDDKIYCFVSLDHNLIDGTNPYTGKPFDRDVKSEIYEMRMSHPLSFYSRRMCPIFENDTNIIYVTYSERYGGYYLVNTAISYSGMKVYRGTLKTPRTKEEVLFAKNRFENIRLVYDGASSQPRTRIIAKAKGSGLIVVGEQPIDLDLKLLSSGSSLFLELQAYMSNSGLSLSAGSVATLKSQRIRLDSSLILFRGFSFANPRWVVSIDDEIELDDLTDASSWTSNECIAEFFAGAGSRDSRNDKKRYGYVMRYEARPDEVVIDTRILKRDVLDELTLTGADQAEILLDKRKRMVIITALLINGEYVHTILSKEK